MSLPTFPTLKVGGSGAAYVGALFSPPGRASPGPLPHGFSLNLYGFCLLPDACRPACDSVRYSILWFLSSGEALLSLQWSPESVWETGTQTARGLLRPEADKIPGDYDSTIVLIEAGAWLVESTRRKPPTSLPETL